MLGTQQEKELPAGLEPAMCQTELPCNIHCQKSSGTNFGSFSKVSHLASLQGNHKDSLILFHLPVCRIYRTSHNILQHVFPQ
uniref:Niemann-Pick C1 protein-like n=1 Tax=Rhizophora mucronata TaxID=61149 RepID=A0A2P2MGA2_RHIMU